MAVERLVIVVGRKLWPERRSFLPAWWGRETRLRGRIDSSPKCLSNCDVEGKQLEG